MISSMGIVGAGTSRRWLQSQDLSLRAVPLVGSVAFVVIAVNYALWWDPLVHHVDAWWVPSDFYINYFATSAFVHGHWGAIYAGHTGFISFPGVIALLAPAVAMAQALHLSLGVPYTAVSTPTTWLVLEPIALLAGTMALFSVDAVARRLELPVLRRSLLMAVEVVALWDLLENNWHPEDALAVAFVLWAILAVLDGRWRRAGWLLGLAVAFQPLALLALAAVVALAPKGTAGRLLVRAGLPAALLLAGPVIANPRTTLRAVIDQPAYPLVNHPTPWLHFAPRLSEGVVAGGPVRLVAVIVAVLVSWFVCRRTERPELVLWVVAVSFAARSLFEAVMVAYYIWPTLAVGLIVAARARWARFGVVCVLSLFATFFALHGWRGEWGWWSVLVLCIGAVLVAAWPARPGIRCSPVRRSPMATTYDRGPDQGGIEEEMEPGLLVVGSSGQIDRGEGSGGRAPLSLAWRLPPSGQRPLPCGDARRSLSDPHA
jgi:hypothetical protein